MKIKWTTILLAAALTVPMPGRALAGEAPVFISVLAVEATVLGVVLVPKAAPSAVSSVLEKLNPGTDGPATFKDSKMHRLDDGLVECGENRQGHRPLVCGGYRLFASPPKQSPPPGLI
ncbi:MAG TPA: hypothetical protein PLL10_10085, partial [Elusimicrobiales bacterium]|nr:hypothetical protein [Elusimicrobiales bacterium]